MHSLNEAQVSVLRAAADGELYRTPLGNYRISGQNGFCPAAYWLIQAGLLERTGEQGTFLSWQAHLVQGETIRPTEDGRSVLATITVHTRAV